MALYRKIGDDYVKIESLYLVHLTIDRAIRSCEHVSISERLEEAQDTAVLHLSTFHQDQGPLMEWHQDEYETGEWTTSPVTDPSMVFTISLLDFMDLNDIEKVRRTCEPAEAD